MFFIAPSKINHVVFHIERVKNFCQCETLSNTVLCPAVEDIWHVGLSSRIPLVKNAPLPSILTVNIGINTRVPFHVSVLKLCLIGPPWEVDQSQQPSL